MQTLRLHKLALHSYLFTFHPNLLQIFKCTYSNRNIAMDKKFASKCKSDLLDIFHSAIKAVSPNEIIKKKVKIQNNYIQNTLYIDKKFFPLKENVYLVGFGKAIVGMAIELEKILGSMLKKGIVSIPSISKDAIWTSEDKSSFPKLYNSVIEYRVGSINNQPDSRSLDTTHDIIDLVEKLTETDTLIVLISGGGSALLYMPRPVIDQEDKLELCKKLQNAGADITELNTVRKKLSLVKGGGLARMAFPASVITLILSDIIGDPVGLIASGPTVYDAKAPENTIAILKKYNLYQSLEGDLKKTLTSKETFNDNPLLNPDKQFKHVTNIILGNNVMALEAASFEASCKKFTPFILRNDVRGNVQDVSSAYVHITSLICRILSNELEVGKFYDEVRSIPILPLSIDKVNEIFHLITRTTDIGGILLIGGGEPTVMVTGRGKGGRNQELALRFSLDWLAKIKSYSRFAEFDVIMLSGGTDGQDGPTDAAGAFGYAAIAPMVHDLYAKVQSMITEDVSQILSQREMKVTNRQNWLQDASHKQDERINNKSITQPSIESQEQNTNINIKKKLAQGYIEPLILTKMEVERMLPENTLKENDTYNFYSRFKKGTDLIKTGFTGTNVMDLHLIYIRKRPCKCEMDISNELNVEENILDMHDLHIDETTIERYKDFLKFQDTLQDAILTTEKSLINIKITDENLSNEYKKCKFE